MLDRNKGSMIAYHYSKSKFDKFDPKFIGSNLGDFTYGYGFYFTTKRDSLKETNLYGSYLYTVELDIKNILQWGNKLCQMFPIPNITKKISEEELKKLYLERGKKITKYAQDLGYDSIQTGLQIVVFDENKIKIMDRTLMENLIQYRRNKMNYRSLNKILKNFLEDINKQELNPHLINIYKYKSGQLSHVGEILEEYPTHRLKENSIHNQKFPLDSLLISLTKDSWGLSSNDCDHSKKHVSNDGHMDKVYMWSGNVPARVNFTLQQQKYGQEDDYELLLKYTFKYQTLHFFNNSVYANKLEFPYMSLNGEKIYGPNTVRNALKDIRDNLISDISTDNGFEDEAEIVFTIPLDDLSQHLKTYQSHFKQLKNKIDMIIEDTYNEAKDKIKQDTETHKQQFNTEKQKRLQRLGGTNKLTKSKIDKTDVIKKLQDLQDVTPEQLAKILAAIEG